MNCSSKIAVVTGAAGGIGLAVVKRLIAAGLKVAAGDLSAPKLGELPVSERCSACVLDVTDVASVARFAADVEARWGGVDVLVNSAGIFRRTPIVGLKENAATEIVDVNLLGTLRCMARFAEGMVSRRRGRIINIASLAGEQGAALAAAYAASKAGVIAATYSAARELGAYGIQVNAVAPGFTNTAMLAPERSLVERFVVPRLPAGRLGEADEVAEAVFFLALCESEYLNGSVLRIDGGLSVG